MATVIYTDVQLPVSATGSPPFTRVLGSAAEFKIYLAWVPVTSPATARVDTFFGTGFTYNPADKAELTGGTVTRFQTGYADQTVFTITDINLSARDLWRAYYDSAYPKYPTDLLYAGSDSILGAARDDLIRSGAGADTIIAMDGADQVMGGDGDDDINGNKGEDYVEGGYGADTVRGGQGNDTVNGGEGADPHLNGNLGDDIVSGGGGADTVYGGQGNDTLYGDANGAIAAGSDVLSGDLGFDMLYGGGAADRFVLRAGSQFDRVADFNAAEGDRVQLAPGATYTITSFEGYVLIDIGGGDQLGLIGVPQSSFNTAWIVFA